MGRFVHDFLKWFPVALGGGAIAIAGVWSPAKDWIAERAGWAWAEMSEPWIAILVVLSVAGYAAAIIWTGQERPQVPARATPITPDQPSQSSSVVTLGIKVTRAPAFDVALTEAALYAVTGNWGMIAGKEHFPTNRERVAAGNKVADWLADFEQKASDGSVRVWGKPRGQSDSPLVEIDALHWRDHEAFALSVANGEPTTRLRGVPSSTDGFEDLRVNKAEFEQTWPSNEVRSTLETVLTGEPGKLVLTNLSSDNMWLAGTKLGDGQRDLEAIPRQVPKGHFYYLFTDKLEAWAIEKYGLNAKRLVPLDFYLFDAGKAAKYIAKCAVLVVITEGYVTLNPQNLGTERGDW